MSEYDPTAPDEWLEFVVHPPTTSHGAQYIALQNEYGIESYTVDQAKGIRAALDVAIEQAEADD